MLITARIEDRVPGQHNDVAEVLDLLDAPTRPPRPGSVANRRRGQGPAEFSVLVVGGRLDEATELLADVSLTGALSTKDVTDLRWRHAVASDALDAKLFAGLEQHLNGRDDLRAKALRMSLLERMALKATMWPPTWRQRCAYLTHRPGRTSPSCSTRDLPCTPDHRSLASRQTAPR